MARDSRRSKRFPPAEPVHVMMKWPKPEPNVVGEHFAVLGVIGEVAEDGRTAWITDADGERVRVRLHKGLAFSSLKDALEAEQALMQRYLSGDDPFGRADPHLLRVAKGQLEHLKGQLQCPPLDYDDLLRLSAILRQLLVDNDGLGQSAWNTLGYAKAVRIQTTYIDDLLENICLRDSSVNIAANGVVIGSMWHGSWGQCDPHIRARLQEDLAPFGDDAYEPTTLILSDYLRSTCIYLAGVKVSRRHLVKYVANKLGGIHYDTARNKEDALELASYNALDYLFDFYSAYPKDGRLWRVVEGRLHALHLALLAVGRDVTESKDINFLLKKIKQAFL